MHGRQQCRHLMKPLINGFLEMIKSPFGDTGRCPALELAYVSVCLRRAVRVCFCGCLPPDSGDVLETTEDSLVIRRLRTHYYHTTHSLF
jgi:hypothetical protein